jgi:hypothetical protein
MFVIACDKREAFAQGSAATPTTFFLPRHDGLLREPVIGRAFADPLARNDDSEPA